MPNKRRAFPNLNMTATFLLVVAASYGLWLANAVFAQLGSPKVLTALGLGVLYCLLGTIGYTRVRQMAPIRWSTVTAYFIVQLGVGFDIVGLLDGRNPIPILLIPLAWQSVLMRSRATRIWVNLVLCLGFLLLYQYLHPDLADALRMSMLPIAGVIIGALFGQLIVSEQDMRAEIDAIVADLTQKNATLQTYITVVGEAAIAGEQKRLAREIHDALGHYLGASAMQVQSARALLAESALGSQVADVMDALRKAEGLSQEALADLQRSAQALGETTVGHHSLSAVLEELCRITNMGTAVQIDFEMTGRPRALPPSVELILYRVTQEGLTNLHRHAAASTAQLMLHYGTGTVRLVLQDDGVGPPSDDSTETQERGSSLLNLRERVQQLGGTLRTGYGIDGGFALEVEVPG